jgi:hypothetical protein
VIDCSDIREFTSVDLLSVHTQLHRDAGDLESSQEVDITLKQELEIQHEKFVAVVNKDQQVAVFGNYEEYSLSLLNNANFTN